MKATLAALAAAALLAACASTPPTMAPAELAPPPAWQARVPAGTASPADWWQRFGDPLLPALISAAQGASATLAQAGARIAQARATRVAAGAALLPQLNAQASASNGRSVPGQPVAASGSIGAQASWEIDLFGAAAAGRNAAQARLEGAEAGWHDARTALAAETATSYAELRACEAQLVQVQLDADSRAETARITGISARAGFTAPADAALASAAAAQGRSQALAQRAACDTLVKSLVELTAIDEPALRTRLAEATARVPVAAAFAPGALPAQLLERRPDLAQAARDVTAAAADRAQARANELPQVSLTGQLARSSLRSGGVTVTGNTWSLGPLTVSLPLFDGGARAASTAAAGAAYDAAAAQYRAKLRQAVREVEAALVALDATAEREPSVEQAARDYRTALAATQSRQRSGLASVLDLELSRRNAAQAETAVIDLQRERVAAWISLYRSLGGGWNAGT